MKRTIMTTLAIISGLMIKATDRIVQENGPAATFNSITAAVSAAVDGDIIIINNKVSNLPWTEDITVNKSLTFISAVDNQKFLVNGVYTIERDNNREIVINGMDNQNTGNSIVYSSSGVSNTSNRTKVSLVNSILDGHINLDLNGYELNVISSILNRITMRYGNVYGSELAYVDVRSETVSNNLLINIIGNKIITPGYWVGVGMEIQCSSSFFNIQNNFVKTSNSNSRGIEITRMKDSIILDNYVINNTILTYRNSGIHVTGNYSLVVLNNLIDNSSTFGGDGISNNNTKAYFGYNFISTDFSTSFDGIGDNSTNNKANVINLSSTPTAALSSDVFYNAGNPSNEYLDLDLTQNDAGCFGGSYSFTNFHPINNGKSSVVGFAITPRIVNQGDTFRVDAVGFDK